MCRSVATMLADGMARAPAIRILLAAFLVLAQFASGNLAAQVTAKGAPCSVHAALVSAAEDHASAHRGHDEPAKTADHAHEGAQEDGDAAPQFSFACCAACAVGLTAADTLLQTSDWLLPPPLAAAHGLEPGEIPSTDPPPRILL